MSKENIWRFLKHKGFSDVAAAAIMGNMEAESGCISYRLQGDFGKNFQRSKDYTAQVDAGIIGKNEFVYNGPSSCITVPVGAVTDSASGRIRRERRDCMIWHRSRGFPSEMNFCR